MADATGGAVATRVWRTLLTLLPTSSGPLALQHAPFLARGQLGSLGEPLSSIQYRVGTRADLLEALDGVVEDLPPLGRDDSKFDGYQELSQLNEDVLRFGDLTMRRQAEVLSCLNCMTEHRVGLPLVAALSSDYFDDAAGCCALYEAARCLIRVRPQDRQSRGVLDRLSRQDLNPRMATAAAVQLGAASVRLDEDLEAGARALDVADSRRREVDRTTSSFAGTLLDSRYFRALALLALRRRDFALLPSAMEQAKATAEALMAQTTPADEYPRLVALENLRLVVEVHMVAAAGRQDPSRFAEWAGRLLEVDPEDPFTWQYIAIYGARCGCVVDAALAASGLAATGGMSGLDLLEVTTAIGRARAHGGPDGNDTNDTNDTNLRPKILATLERILRPDSPARAA